MTLRKCAYKRQCWRYDLAFVSWTVLQGNTTLAFEPMTRKRTNHNLSFILFDFIIAFIFVCQVATGNIQRAMIIMRNASPTIGFDSFHFKGYLLMSPRLCRQNRKLMENGLKRNSNERVFHFFSESKKKPNKKTDHRADNYRFSWMISYMKHQMDQKYSNLVRVKEMVSVIRQSQNTKLYWKSVNNISPFGIFTSHPSIQPSITLMFQSKHVRNPNHV